MTIMMLVCELSIFMLSNFLRTTDSTAKWEPTLLGIGASWWVRDAKGAVDTTTVLQLRIAGAIVLIVARVAHIVGAKAAEEGNVTAIHALPVNLLFAMNLIDL